MEKIWFDESICLRAAKLSDAPAMFRMIDTQRQYLGRWLPFVAETRTENDSYAYLQSVLSVPSERRELLCTITADGRFAGLVGFKDTDRANRKTEIGYCLRRIVSVSGSCPVR